jgi:hypothetical protein
MPWRDMRMPWHDVPGDDGFEWSLNLTRLICAGLLLFPVFFLLCALAIMLAQGTPHEEPVLVGVFVALAVSLLPAAPFIRERMAQVGIGIHLEGEKPWLRHRPVYATFATATITAFMVAQAPALLGFIATALTRSFLWLELGSAASYIAWVALWPRRVLWARWTWQSRIGREGDTSHPAVGSGSEGSGEGSDGGEAAS